MKKTLTVLIIIAMCGCGQQKNAVTDKTNQDESGKELRLMALTTPAQKLKFAADDDYPKVYGIIADWNIAEATASILAMKDGGASLYTTSTIGIFGGEGRDSVKKAAEICVKVAGEFYETSVPVSKYPYPDHGKVNFYLLTYDGVRLCVGDEAGIKKGTDPTAPLFAAAQGVLTSLRIGTEPKMK